MPLVGKVLGALVLTGLMWLWVDWRQAAAALTGIDPWLLLLAATCSVTTILISARKWQGLLARIEVQLVYGLAARLYWIGAFFSNFLPTSVGGDAVRLLLTPARERLSEVAGTILIERLTGLLVMLALSALGLAVQPPALGGGLAGDLLLALVLALAAAVAVALLVPRFLLIVLARLARVTPAPLQRPLAFTRKLAAGIVGPACDHAAVSWAILMSLPFYAANILVHYLLLRGVGAEIGIVQVLLAAPLVHLVGLVPLTINGLVLTEGAFVLIYASCGVAPELALAAALLRRLIDMANSSFGGLFWLGWPGATTEPGPAAAAQTLRPLANAEPVAAAAYRLGKRAA